MPKKKLQKLIKERPGLMEFSELINSLPDRPVWEAVMVGVSSLDVLLEHALSSKFVELSENERNAIFDGAGNGPLSSVSGKLRIAHALGLISVTVRDDIQLLIQIRNTLAHGVLDLQLDNLPLNNEITFQTPLKFDEEESKAAGLAGGKLYGRDRNTIGTSVLPNGKIISEPTYTKVLSADNLLIAYIPHPKNLQPDSASARVVQAIQVCWYLLMAHAAPSLGRTPQKQKS